PQGSASSPASRSSSAPRGLIPFPFEAFSPFAITKSISWSRRQRGRVAASARRPGRPTTSPRNNSRIGSVRDLAGSRLADHRDLDLTGIRHLLLDTTRHVACKHRRLVVRNGPRVADHPDLAPRLPGI